MLALTRNTIFRFFGLDFRSLPTHDWRSHHHSTAVHACSDRRHVGVLYRDSQLNVSVETADLEPVGLEDNSPVATFVEPYRGRPQLKGMRVRSKPAGAGSGRCRLKRVVVNASTCVVANTSVAE